MLTKNTNFLVRFTQLKLEIYKKSNRNSMAIKLGLR